MATQKLAILWEQGPGTGSIEIKNGRLGDLIGAKGSDDDIGVKSKAPCRQELTIRNAVVRPGPGATIVAVKTPAASFSFFSRDVTAAAPIWIPAYGVAVTEAADSRTYAEVVEAIRARGLQSDLHRLEAEPEETYEQAVAATRRQHVPLWLGISRDIRIFELGYSPQQGYWGYINPRRHGNTLRIPEVKDSAVWYGFVLGRGAACEYHITRRLEDGVLPILRSQVLDGDITYELTAFVTLEKSPLTPSHLRGTHFMVADENGAGHMFTPAQQEQVNQLRDGELNRDEETVLFLRAVAVNTARVPRYAWFKNLYHGPNGKAEYDGATGCQRFSESGRVFSISRLNGGALPQNEMAVLLQPGEQAVFEIILPHQPIPPERAAALAQADFEARRRECRAFWEGKLAAAAQVDLPEPVINEMVKAGLLHLDLVAYGLEPHGPLTPCIGVYCPIGSESSPIIQFMDSMGCHDWAERAIRYFLEKQHDDGFIQNFGGYMLETGAALWTMGEHYRYTRNDAWVAAHQHQFIKACEHTKAWRDRNKKEELRGRGYGMQEGKVADPEDPFHCFMLNGWAYQGMSRVAEMLAKTNPAEATRWATEAAAFKADIRASLEAAMAAAPVVPLADGSWVPAVPAWPEATGLSAVFAEPGNCWTHGTFMARDSMLGAMYLILQEVLDPNEPAADFIVNWNAELMTVRNVAFSQPFYCRNDIAHAKRGEVKPYLKTWYNGFTGLADRETYTWWEHYFQASPHKTHEEGWWLMQTRWLLWREDGDTLRLLPCAPRRWFEHGKTIRLENIATYFGPVTLLVESHLRDGIIKATVTCDSDRQPYTVRVRLPHPQGRRAVKVTGGHYDAATETVVVAEFKNTVSIVLQF